MRTPCHSERELYALELLTNKGNWRKKLHAAAYEPLIAIGVLQRDHGAEVYRVVDMRTNAVIWEAESARVGGTGALLELRGPVAAFISNYRNRLNR